MKTQNAITMFKEMSLTPQIIRAIEEVGYTQPTSIQTGAIPLLLDGHDLIGRSSTGSGKTAAFAIPAIEGLNPSSQHAQVLILSPTRELAIQIYNEMKKFSKYNKEVRLAVVFGGSSMSSQIKQLRQANIVIGTPGRLIDHVRRKTLKLNHIQKVVLDEADEMLNMGFIEDIKLILNQVPDKRQTVLFSATMSPELLAISNTFLKNPQTIDVLSKKESQANIEQTFYQVPQRGKKDVLTLLMHANEQRSIVFSNTKSMVDELSEMLSSQGFKVSGLHGDMTQAARSQVMNNFRNGTVQTLIATDVAARGIDVDDINVIINYDLPQTFEYYIHRIGRTGRAGKKGLSQTLICNGKQYATLNSLMKFTGNSIKECSLPSSNDILEKVIARKTHEIEELSKNHSGNAAQKLVDNLLVNDIFNGSTEQITLALAEAVIGSDGQLDRLKELESLGKNSSRKRSSQNKKKARPEKARKQSFGQRNSRPSKKQKHKNGGSSKSTHKRKLTQIA